jgi:hypothetical protein
MDGPTAGGREQGNLQKSQFPDLKFNDRVKNTGVSVSQPSITVKQLD